jgi:fumarate hydratase subunit beta
MSPGHKTALKLNKLKAGNEILLSGVMYTARDQAHKRLIETLARGRKPPINLKGKIIYYCGPTRTPKGKVIGSCGPTTSSRMDEFTPALLKAGISGMIGKGERCGQVRQAIKKYKGVYFLTHAGCGALLSQFVTSKTLVAYKDLGPEAIYQLTVKDFPLIVAIDTKGRSIYG